MTTRNFQFSNFCFFPKQCLHYGVLAGYWVREGSASLLGPMFAKIVAQTIGFTTFSKKVMLWLQWQGRSLLWLQWQGHFFRKTL